MFQTLDDIRPDVVAVPGWSFGDALSGLSWCAKTGTPCVLMSETMAEDKGRTGRKEWVKRRVVELCSAGLVGGRPQANYLAALGMPRERIFLGYDVVDNRYFADKVAEIRNSKFEIRSQQGLPEKFFLASARFLEKKNLPRLIEAYARYRVLCEDNRQQTTDRGASVVRGPIVPWSLVVLGDGPLRSELCRLISDLQLEHCVLLPGFKQYSDLPIYYGLASTFVHASTTEPWGLVVNEAMASSLPVLVSNRCGCAPDLVEDGVNGFSFDPYNIEQLAQLMFQVSAFQISRLSEMGTASRRIITDWGPDRFASGLKAATEKALEIGPAKATWMQRMSLSALLLR